MIIYARESVISLYTIAVRRLGAGKKIIANRRIGAATVLRHQLYFIQSCRSETHGKAGTRTIPQPVDIPVKQSASGAGAHKLNRRRRR